MESEKPIACFDIESTGVDPAKDRIITIAISIDGSAPQRWMVDPGMHIPAEATEVHGISNEDVYGKPYFREIANEVFDALAGCDLLGFNARNFDVPLLWEEFFRAGIIWDLSGMRILDAGILFKLREPRTLSAAYEHYCGKKHDGAHDAAADVRVTNEVWSGQIAMYGLHEATREQLERFSSYDDQRIDLAGKLVFGADGRPAYNIGKARGVAVEDDLGFGHWMLDRDFSMNTKQHLQRILDDISKKMADAAAAKGIPF